MYCPNCAAQNVEDARFCRACGSDISLVPQALTGKLPEARREDAKEEARRRRLEKKRQEKTPTVEKGIQSIFAGIGFLLVSIAVYFFGPAGKVWFFWLFLPAFGQIGSGIATIMRARREQARALPPPHTPEYVPPAMPPAWNTRELSGGDRAGGYAPRSVTEGTTRHLANAGEEFRPRPEPESRTR